MVRRVLCALILVAVAVARPSASMGACPGCVATQVTAANASTLLFGGSDAAGGIDDWYVSNGTVQAIIDDIGTVPTGAAGVEVDKTSSNAVQTGGTLVDLGMNGKNNDQLPQSFNVGGLSLANVFLFRQGDEVAWGVAAGNNPCTTIGAQNTQCALDAADADCSGITVYGVMLGSCANGSGLCSTQTAPKVHVRTTYKACNGQNFLDMRTEVWNQSGATQPLPVFDILLWGGRGVTPFAPDKGRGFTHPTLDLGSTSAIVNALTSAPFFAAPGNVSALDGVMARGKKPNAVSYGYQSLGADVDSNGGAAGGTITTAFGPNTLQSLQSSLLSAVTVPLPGAFVPNGASVIYKRRIILAARNDAASVIGDAGNPNSILGQTGLPLGTVSGGFSPGSTQEGTVTFIRTGGDDLSTFGASFAALNSAAISSVRTKSSFSNVQLPSGTYTMQAVFPGRDDVIVSGITVTAGKKTAIAKQALPKPGKLQLEVRDADTNKGIPAKVSLSPSPSLRRDFAAFNFDVRTGMCSNNLKTQCTNDTDCGSGNVCFRTCTNVEPPLCTAGCTGGATCASDGRCRSHACSSDSDCTAGYLCKANTTNTLPESYPGGVGQVQVLYSDKSGKIKAEVKPGTYTLSISRGVEYSIRKVENVALSAGGTTKVPLQTLRRVVDTTGYLSADFHIHSGRSLDSSAPLEARARSFASEGLEVMVSTDHDIVTDYQPIIKKQGFQPFVTSIVGTEVTTSVPRQPFLSNGWGHINGWPTVYDPNLRRSGSVEDESVSASVIYDRLRAFSNSQCVGGTDNGKECPPSACPGGKCLDVGEQIVQMNHPRSSVSGVVNIGMYDNIGYDPSKAVNSCQRYPVICPTSQCAGGTNDGTNCTSNGVCTGGGSCGCVSASVPLAANGCNNILNDLNVVPQATLCTNPGCGGGFEGPNGTRNIDFDLMEIENAGKVTDFPLARRMRRDWLSFLNQGLAVGKAGARHQMWGTGVSDSHRLVAELPGYARTFVAAGEFPQKTGILDIKAFDDSVLAGNMVATAGPYIEFTADNGGTAAKIGETLAGAGAVNLNVRVQAPAWIPVDEVRLIKNGCVVRCFNASTTPGVTAAPSDPYDQTTSGVVRFDATIADTVTGDSYYIVEASPNLPSANATPAENAIVSSVAEGAFPYAFTNPIFADANGGGYTGIALPAGAGEPVCPAVPASCSAGAVLTASRAATHYGDAESPSSGFFFARLLDRLAQPAVADSGAPQDDEAARIEQHEQDIRKSSEEYYPRHLIEFPTPRPEEVQRQLERQGLAPQK